MANTKTFLELNGRRYDARTGQALDGFLPAAHTPAAPHHLKPAAHAPVARHAAQHAKHRAPQRSKTLMRHGLAKPQASAAEVASPSTFAPLATVHAKREARAHTIQKSSRISKFSLGGKPAVAVKNVDLPVAQAPEAAPPLRFGHTHSNTSAPAAHHQPSKAHEAVFSEALNHANSHQQPTLPKRAHTHQKVASKLGVGSKIVGVGAGLLAAALLIGFIAYQNVPNLTMRLAAAKAGVHAAMPGYQPTGFALNGPVQYSPGQITLNFKAHGDNRAYQLVQQSTKWDSDTLKSKYVAVNDRPYQTFQANNKTIYIYGNSTATWVNNGVWYQISGNASLNNDQLLQIARSL